MRYALILLILIITASPARSGLRQALQHYQRNDYLAAVGALKGEKGEKADYISARCLIRLAEIYARLSEYHLKYGLDYFGELEKGEGNAKSENLPYFKALYVLWQKGERVRDEEIKGFVERVLPFYYKIEFNLTREGLAAMDEPAVTEDVEQDKRLLFYSPGAHDSAAQGCEADAGGALKGLSAHAGRYSAMSGYYHALLLFHCRDTGDVFEGEKAKSLFLRVGADESLSDAYRGPARVYAAACEGGDALATAGEDVHLKSLALKLESEQGGKDAQFVAVAEELREKLADGKNRTSLHLLGQYYLNIGEEGKALEVLERARDKSNKNSIAHNDPVFMLDLARAYYLINRYDECLEILMALSEVFPGLRPLQNSVQGVYAARQKSAGQVRINQ